MSDSSTNEKAVYWPRVKELLDNIMDRWKKKEGRDPAPGIHDYYWETPQKLAEAVLMRYRAIEPGVPGKDTHLVQSLAWTVGTYGKMPLHGPFLSPSEVDEIAAWIDAGMPEGPAG